MVRTGHLIPGVWVTRASDRSPPPEEALGGTLRPTRGCVGGRPDSRRSGAVVRWTHDLAAPASDAVPGARGSSAHAAPRAVRARLDAPLRRAAGGVPDHRSRRLLRRPEPHQRQCPGRRAQRRPPRRSRAGVRRLRRARPPTPRAPGRRRGARGQRDLHLRALAGHRDRAGLAGLAPARRVRGLSQRPADQRAGRHGDRGDVPGGAAAAHGSGLPRHGHPALRGLPRPAAALLHQPVRRDAELPRRVGPPRRDRPGPGGRSTVAARRRDGAAAVDVDERGGHRQPLLRRRRRRGRDRADLALAGHVAPSES
jgi:hypothetical protein